MANSQKTKEEMQKGLSALLGNINKAGGNSGNNTQGLSSTYLHFSEIPLSSIIPNPKNPRRTFDKQHLDELAHSIRIHGLIQPITVLRLENQTYQIISGERRWRAAKQAGLSRLPAYIRKANDHDMVEWAIIENLQREDLNPIEVALGLQRMIDEMNYTQEQVAERIGKDRSTISNTIRLLKLPPDVQLALKQDKISTGHARAIINVGHIDQQLSLLKSIQEKGLSVRQTEQAVKQLQDSGKKEHVLTAKHTVSINDIHVHKMEEELMHRFQTKVNILLPRKGTSGKIEVAFHDIKELNAIYDRIKSTKN